MTQKAKNGIDRDFPDAEESQDVINTEGIEVLRHPVEAFPEPRNQVCEIIPIIGGKAPVLTVLGEGIGRSTCLRIEIEERRMSLGLHTVEIDADGDITFQDDAFGTGIVGSSLQLEVKVVLGEVDSGLSGFSGFSGMARMARQPLGIGLEPIAVGSEPRFELLGIEGLTSTLLKEIIDKFRLHTVDRLVITIADGIEFAALAVIGCHFRLVLQTTEGLQIQIMRVKGKSRHDIIWIGIAPRM